MKIPILWGATAVGKTDIALRLAEKFQGEIVSADSRAIYCYMDIGTAKPTLIERARVPHHLINVIDPDGVLTLADIQQHMRQALDQILQKHKMPFVVGGTGLYIRALIDGFIIPQVAPNPTLRAQLTEFAYQNGTVALHTKLIQVDPDAAIQIDHHNIRRVIRALEVFYKTGQPFSNLRSRIPPSWEFMIIGLTRPSQVMHQRIESRVDNMLRDGLIDETKRLLKRGYLRTLPAMSGIGYRQIVSHLIGEISLVEAVTEIKKSTWNLYRQQRSWFRANDSRFIWIDLETSNAYEDILEKLYQEKILPADK